MPMRRFGKGYTESAKVANLLARRAREGGVRLTPFMLKEALWAMDLSFCAHTRGEPLFDDVAIYGGPQRAPKFELVEAVWPSGIAGTDVVSPKDDDPRVSDGWHSIPVSNWLEQATRTLLRKGPFEVNEATLLVTEFLGAAGFERGDKVGPRDVARAVTEVF